MLVVSNTSPLSNLAIIGRLNLAREQLSQIIIPPAVAAELSRNPYPLAREALQNAFNDGWIEAKSLAGSVTVEFSLSLDLGEAEVLTLALELQASLVLLDESAARMKAAQHGIAHTGVLGVLRQAKTTGRIPSLKTEIGRLRTEARFFVAPALEKALLISVGES
jgi:predicted nucleic acid-binding protein